jgi:type II secretory pathway pseudopilin PulG
MKLSPTTLTTARNHPQTWGGRKFRPGMTLLELTVVILVLLTLISVLFFGATAWKRGSDRATCILQLHSVQKGLRSYANLTGYSPGDNATNLKAQIIGLGKFIEVQPKCPSLGTYTFGDTFGVDTIPPVGELYMVCSLAAANDHLPTNTAEW